LSSLLLFLFLQVSINGSRTATAGVWNYSDGFEDLRPSSNAVSANTGHSIRTSRRLDRGRGNPNDRMSCFSVVRQLFKPQSRCYIKL